MAKKFYFDFKDGVSKRDRIGIFFQHTSEAITHSKALARAERAANPSGHHDLIVSVINESGAEVHTEKVYTASSPPDDLA